MYRRSMTSQNWENTCNENRQRTWQARGVVADYYIVIFFLKYQSEGGLREGTQAKPGNLPVVLLPQ